MTRDDARERLSVFRNRISYRIVPGGATFGYYLFRPQASKENAPLLVSVHGISRNAEEHIRAFAALAEARAVAVLAPLFDRQNFRGFQRLWTSPRNGGHSAEPAFLAMLDDVSARTGLDAGRLCLFGHSGGAQFVHRFAMAHPDRVVRYVVSAAGWYTLPDLARPYPYGMKPSRRVPPEARFDIDAFLRIPACVFVGERDTQRDRALNTASTIDSHQGTSRRERAEAWIGAMTTAARWRGLDTCFTLRVLPGSGHDFTEMVQAGLAEAAFRFLFD